MLQDPRWPKTGQLVEIAQRVEWAYAGRDHHGQVAEIDHTDERSVVVVDGNDGNRWHFDLNDDAKIVRRFPIPLPVLPSF